MKKTKTYIVSGKYCHSESFGGDKEFTIRVENATSEVNAIAVIMYHHLPMCASRIRITDTKLVDFPHYNSVIYADEFSNMNWED